MQETNEVKDNVTLEEKVAENLKDEQVATEEVQPANDGEAVAVEGEPKKKNGLKNFIQLVLFILLSMAGFIVQMIIEQVGFRIPAIKNLNEQTFNLFGLPQEVGSFIITMIAVFICKLINFILHRKVLFKARANLAFSIAMYLIFSIVLWIGSAAVKAPVKNALMGNEWWVSHITSDPEGWAVTVAVMVYSTADLIIMFFAEKFLIMNDKLFKKGREQAAEGEAVAVEGETASEEKELESAKVEALVSEPVVAADMVEETSTETAVAEVEEKEEESKNYDEDEIVILSQNDMVALPDEDVKVEIKDSIAEEEKSDAPVLSLEEAAAAAEVEVAQEEKAKTEEKPAAKKTSTTKKTTAAKKPASKTSTAKKTTTTATAKKATTTATAKKATTAKAEGAKKTTVKATATKAPASKTTAAKSASATKKTTTAKSTATAKKTASTATKKPAAKKTDATAAKKED